jgi:hypothetical protein
LKKNLDSSLVSLAPGLTAPNLKDMVDLEVLESRCQKTTKRFEQLQQTIE